MNKTYLLLPLLLGILTGSAAYAQTYTFNGTVTTPDGLSPDVVAGASIVVTPGNHTAVTDSLGKFSMDIPAGAYQVTISGTGYTGYTMDLTLDVSKQVVFSLEPAAEAR